MNEGENSKAKGIGCLVVGGCLLSLPIILLFGGVLLFIILLVTMFSDSSSSGGASDEALEMIPPEYVDIYQEAGEEYDIDWLLLASVHKVETNFSQMSDDPQDLISPVGAVGHMQFMVCTIVGWNYPACADSDLGDANIPHDELIDLDTIEEYDGYGVDGNGDGTSDPYDIEDAVHTAGNYLSANMSGDTEQDKIENALYTYNNSYSYVDDVMFYYDWFSEGYDDGNYEVDMEGDMAWVVPSTKNITSGFGGRDTGIDGASNNHSGIDIAGANSSGTPIVSWMDGEVITSTAQRDNNGNITGWGYYVVVDHGNGFRTLYAHMMSQGKSVGTEVEAGERIGFMGTSGTSSGTHLHFEIHQDNEAVNPMVYLTPFGIEE